MSEMILCEALLDGGFPSKLMYYQNAEGNCDKNLNIIREKVEIKKGRLYLIAKKVLEGWERNHKKALSKEGAEVYQNYKIPAWKRVK